MIRRAGLLLSFVYLLFFLLPIVILGIDFFDIEIFKKLFTKKTINIFINTTVQSLLSVVLSLCIAIPISVYLSRRNNIFTKIVESTIFIPFFFPSVATGIAIYQLLKGTDLNYTLFSIVVAHIFYNSPIIVKYLSDSLKGVDSDLIESAKMDGAGKIRIFFSITFFQVKDGLFRGLFLAFVYCFTSFAVILSVGNVKYSSFETAIYTSMFAKFNIKEAFLYALVQFVILSLINILFFHNPKSEITKKYNNTPNKKIKPELLLFVVIIYALFEYGIILNSMGLAIINPTTGKVDFSHFFGLFGGQFNRLFPVVSSIINSLLLSLVVALASIFVVVTILSNRSKFSDYAILLTFGFSTTFIALLLYYLYIKFNINLVLLVIVGLSLISIPIGYSFMYDNFVNFDKNITSLAKLDGANWLETFLYIKFPILKNTIIATFFQIFTIVYGEFTLVFSMKIQKIAPLSSITNYLISSKGSLLSQTPLTR